MAGTVKEELLAWEMLSRKNKKFRLIPLTIFWVVWNERNNKAFEGKEDTFGNILNKWFHIFGSIALEHNINHFDDLGLIVNILIDL